MDREPRPLRVVDPVNGTIRPLATPPGITIAGVAPVPAAAGLWVAGRDGTGKPSVSVSRDGGVTWSTHPFGAVPTGETSGGGESFRSFDTLQVSTHDGQAVHVIIGRQSEHYGFRSADGGRTWKPTNGGAALPNRLDMSEPAFTLPDGTHVLQQRVDDGIQPLFSRNEAGTCASESHPGWPATVVRTASDGSYTTADGRTLYRSDDGTNWSKTIPRG